MTEVAADSCELERRLATARSVVAVSPHLDDAVLSAGAALARCAAQGARVVVVSLFAGDAPDVLSPAATRHHQRCSLPWHAVALRREEDHRAMVALGAEPIHGDFVDAVYRRRPDGGWVCESDSDLFGLPPEDDRLVDSMLATMRAAFERFQPDVVLGPAGVGNHVDHALTRDVAIHAAQGFPLLLWADQPYAADSPSVSENEYVRLPDDRGAMAIKLAAAACYGSQLPMLWPDGSWRRALSAAGEAFCSLSSDVVSRANSLRMRPWP